MLTGDDTPMNPTIVPDPCPTCQRFRQIVCAYAEDMIAADDIGIIAATGVRPAELKRTQPSEASNRRY